MDSADGTPVDFSQLLADARAENGVLLPDAATLDALSRLSNSLLNPACYLLPSDVLRYHLRPLVRTPRVLVCGMGRTHTETSALRLCATSPSAWLELDDRLGSHATVARQGDLLLADSDRRDAACSLLSSHSGLWRDGPPMLGEARRYHCAARVDGASVMCAGVAGGEYLASAALLRDGSGSDDEVCWHPAASLAVARAYPGAASSQAHHGMLVAGGETRMAYLDSCELYDAVADRWTLLEARLPAPGNCCAVALQTGAVLVLDDADITDALLCDPRSNSTVWQRVSGVPLARHAPALVAFGEHSALLLGGFDMSAGGRTNTAHCFDLRADRWAVREEWFLPSPSCAHGAVLIE